MNKILLNGDETADEMLDLASLNADFIWQIGRLGGWLRWLRNERGCSINHLSHLSGVAGSEIHGIENGNRECRTQSLVRICAVLGASPGWILDRAMSSCHGIFLQMILADADFPALKERFKIGTLELAKEIASILTCACETEAFLLRCSDPVSRLEGVSFPHEEWRNRFKTFAQKIAGSGESFDRASILEGLYSNPVRELSNQDLLPGIILTERVRDFGTPAGGKKQYGWMVHLLPFPTPLRID
jgi:transcriptional regulator with XRE-family HTH domain